MIVGRVATRCGRVCSGCWRPRRERPIELPSIENAGDIIAAMAASAALRVARDLDVLAAGFPFS
jgi:hypothetical protein